MNKYTLYLRTDGGEYVKYGTGNMLYMYELIQDYIMVNDMYNKNEVEFKIVKVK